jgi:hypothetical protein
MSLSAPSPSCSSSRAFLKRRKRVPGFFHIEALEELYRVAELFHFNSQFVPLPRIQLSKRRDILADVMIEVMEVGSRQQPERAGITAQNILLREP